MLYQLSRILGSSPALSHPGLRVISCPMSRRDENDEREVMGDFGSRLSIFVDKMYAQYLLAASQAYRGTVINILSLLSAKLHNEWRAKSSSAEEEALEWSCRQWRKSFYQRLYCFPLQEINYE